MVPVRFLYSTYLSPKKLMRNFSSPVKGGLLVSYLFFVFILYVRAWSEGEADGVFLSFFLFFFL